MKNFTLKNLEEAALKRYASRTNSYIYSGWDYLKYPQVYFRKPYKKLVTNEIFENIGDNTRIYIGRTND